MPNKVLASRFNTLKGRVDRLLGPCLETNTSTTNYTFGYGENTGLGTNVIPGSPNKIAASSYKLLYINIQKIRYHQVGTAAFTAEAYRVGDFVNNSSADKVEEAYISGLETLATNMESDKFICHPTQGQLAVLPTSMDDTCRVDA